MTVKTQWWDIAGQDHFIGLAPTYYRHAVAAIVVFDITNAVSLENARNWKADIDDKIFLKNGRNIPCIALANKWDLIQNDPHMREVSDDVMDEFCYKNNFLGWFSVSAKTGLNIKKSFNFIIAKIIENQRAYGQQSETIHTAINNAPNFANHENQVSKKQRKQSKCFDKFKCKQICCCCNCWNNNYKHKKNENRSINADLLATPQKETEEQRATSISFLKINNLENDNNNNFLVVDELESEISSDKMIFGLEEFETKRTFNIQSFILTFFKVSILLPITLGYQLYFFSVGEDKLVAKLPPHWMITVGFRYDVLKLFIFCTFCAKHI